VFIINYYLKNMLIKFVNLENYSLEDFYNDIGEYTLQLNNIGGVHYLGMYFYKSPLISDSIAFKLIYYNSIPILYEQIYVKAGKTGIINLYYYFHLLDWRFNIFIIYIYVYIKVTVS